MFARLVGQLFLVTADQQEAAATPLAGRAPPPDAAAARPPASPEALALLSAGGRELAGVAVVHEGQFVDTPLEAP